MKKSTAILLILFMILILCIKGNSQERVIAGTVFDAETNTPLKGIKVSLLDTNKNTITDNKGNYTLKIPESSESVSFSPFKDKTISEIRIIGDNTYDIYLSHTILENLLGLSIAELLNVQVTVASKNEQTGGEAPSTVTVFTQTELKKMGITNVLDLLNYVPGYSSTRSGIALVQRLNVRGAFATSGESVLVMLNGMPLNSLFYGTSIQTLAMATDNIKQIEIVRGPGSALYGSNAYLGVINIITDNKLNSATAYYGNLNRFEGSLNISKSKKKFEVASFIKAFHDDGYLYRNINSKNNAISDVRDPVTGIEFNSTIKYGNLELYLHSNRHESQDFVNMGNTGNNTTHFYYQENHANFNYTWLISEKTHITFSGGYLFDYVDGLVRQALTGTNYGGKILENDYYTGPKSKSYSANMNMDSRFALGDKHNLLIGASYINSALTQAVSQSNYDMDMTYLGSVEILNDFPFNRENLPRNIVGLYIQDQWNLLKSVQLTSGIRYDYYSDFGSSVNPRLSLVYSMPWKGYGKIIYGKAFKAPTYSALYDVSPVAIGNTNIKAENINTIELSYSQSVNDYAFFDFTYFNNNLNNLIAMELDTVIQKLKPTNSNQSKIYQGLETVIKVNLIRSLTVSANYSYIFGDEKLQATHHMASAYVNYAYKYFNWNVSGVFRGKYESVLQESTQKAQSPYFLINLNFSVDIQKNCTLSLFIKNIFDTRYYVNSPLFTTGVPERGREMGLRLLINV